jgi:hypothetical protein
MSGKRAIIDISSGLYITHFKDDLCLIAEFFYIVSLRVEIGQE